MRSSSDRRVNEVQVIEALFGYVNANSMWCKQASKQRAEKPWRTNNIL
jgi:hypothetical protein